MQLTFEKKRQALWFASTTSILSQGLGRKVESTSLPEWSVARLTRKNGRTGKLTSKPIQAPKVYRPRVTTEVEDWETFTGLYEPSSDMNGRFPGFFDEGAGTAAALRAAGLEG